MTRLLKPLMTVLLLALAAGCGALTPVPPGGEKEGLVGAVDGKKANYILILAIERTGADDQTFAACDKLLKDLRIDRAGEDDKIVLVDLSGPGIVTTVNPRIFRSKYKDGLRNALKTPSSGSRVYSVLTDALRDTRVRLLEKENARASLVVFSALRDTLSGDRADGYLLYQIGALDKAGGHCAFYGVDQRESLRWTQSFGDMLRGKWHVSTGPEADDIKLPRFGND